jgi:hypothetical protein
MFEVAPATVALNCRVPPVTDEAVAGVTVTPVTPELDGCEEAPATDTVALADLVGSATLVAVILPTPPAGGAVNTPAAVIVPIDAVQVTESFVVAPWIATVNCTVARGAGVATAGSTTIDETSGSSDEPVPFNGSMAGRCCGSVTNSTFPLTTPTFVAANLTVKLALVPPGRVKGIARPLRLKPVPDSIACVTLTGVAPVFVSVTGSELAEPTLALTVRASGATASEGMGSAIPAHPAQIKHENANARGTRTSFLRRGFISLALRFSETQVFPSVYNQFRPPGGRVARLEPC